jgi:anti-sigma B factor antagonist
MAMTPQDGFSIEVHEGRVVVAGELDMASAPAMSQSILRLEAAAAAQFLLDLSGVTFMGSCAINELLRMRELLSLRVVAVSPQVQRVLDITDLSWLILDADARTSDGRAAAPAA